MNFQVTTLNLKTNFTDLVSGLRGANLISYDYVWVRSPGLRVWLIAGMLIRSHAKVILELPSPIQTFYTARMFAESVSKSRFLLEGVVLLLSLPLFRCSFFRVVQYGNESSIVNLIIGLKRQVQVANPTLTEVFSGVQYLCDSELNKSMDFPTLVFVGKLEFWHGIDRVLMGIRKLKKVMPDLKIELIFVGSISTSQKISIKLILGEWYEEVFKNIGPLSPEQVSDHLIKCGIGIGSIGFHRINLTTASPLKDGFYARCGIPFITSYDDPRFSATQLGRLKVASSDSAIDLMEVWLWYKDLNLKQCNKSLYLASKENHGFVNPIKQSVFGFES